MTQRLCDKYGPRTTLDVLLSQTELGALRGWLRDGGGGVARVTAPPGAGLTTTVALLARELGMESTWFSAGQARARTLLVDAVSSHIAVTGRPKVVVLDEFDALLTDAQLAGELTSLARAGCRTPVLCLGHAVRSSKTDDTTRKWPAFRFQRPPLRAVVDRVAAVAAAEGIACAPGAVEDLCRNARGDLRAALGALEMARADQLRCGESTLDEAMDGLNAVKALLREPVGFARALRMASMDPTVIPMGLFENYTAAARTIETCADVADLYSMADVTDKRMYATQAWELSDLYAALTVAGPTVALDRGDTAQIDKVDPQKFGLVWSKMYNQCAKAKSLRAVCHSRAEAGLWPMGACDLAYVRHMVAGSLAPGREADLERACHGFKHADVLAVMRLWKTEYKTSTHARVKKTLGGR